MTSRNRIDWQKIKLEYLHTTGPVSDLARKYGVKEDTLWKQIQRHRWADEKVEAEQKAFADAAAEASKKRVRELSSFNENDLKIANAIRSRVAKRLQNTETAITMSELRMLASTAEVAQRMGRLALGASTDNVGMGGPGGEGPIAVTNVSREDYVQARNELLQEF